MRFWQAFALVGLAAVLIWLPTLAAVQPGDSTGYDLNWSRQFTAELLAGQPYPRWTATSFAGLGAPTFYFYPPLPFWVTAGLAAASGGLLSALGALQAGELAFLALSGWSMLTWLRPHVGVPRAAAGALLFMLAPYHLDDHYLRGAFAEFAAIAFLPLVAMGLERTASGKRLGALLLAGAWAGVILCHLPMALLAGVLLVAPLGAWLIWRARQRRIAAAAWIGGGLAAGTGLAAIYVVPALALQSAISAGYWERFHIADQLLNHVGLQTSNPVVLLFGAFSLGEAGVALALAWRAHRRGEREAWLWAGIATAVFLAIAGLAPGFWSLPLMANVQFPWRAIGIEEFALAALAARAPRSAWTPLAGAALAAVVGANLLCVAQFATAPATVQRPGYGAFPTGADAPEYLPAGLLRIGADGPSLATPYTPLTALPLTSGPVTAATADITSGQVSLRLSGRAGQVALRRFYFPGWQVTCGGTPVATFAAGPGRLLAFDAPAGATDCQARIAATPPERLGAWLSLAAALLLAGYAAWDLRRRRAPFRADRTR